MTMRSWRCGDRHDRVHVARGAPHMNWHDGSRARPDSGLDRLGIDRDGFVDVDDQRDRADRQHRSRGRHIGVGRDDDFVARSEPDGGHRRGERIAAARGEREMLDAEMLRVARFERFAFIADAIAEKRAWRGSRARSRRSLLARPGTRVPPGSRTEKRPFQSDASIGIGPAKRPRLLHLRANPPVACDSHIGRFVRVAPTDAVQADRR